MREPSLLTPYPHTKYYKPSLANHVCSWYCLPDERIHAKIIEVSEVALARHWHDRMVSAFARCDWEVLECFPAEMPATSHPGLAKGMVVKSFCVLVRVPEGEPCSIT